MYSTRRNARRFQQRRWLLGWILKRLTEVRHVEKEGGPVQATTHVQTTWQGPADGGVGGWGGQNSKKNGTNISEDLCGEKRSLREAEARSWRTLNNSHTGLELGLLGVALHHAHYPGINIRNVFLHPLMWPSLDNQIKLSKKSAYF